MRALITGVTGQDGSYLARFLLAKGYEVHGLKRRSSSFNTGRIDDLIEPEELIETHFGDLTDSVSLMRALQRSCPDEVYNLGAQSHVAVSFENPVYTFDVNALGVMRLLEGIRVLGISPKIYQASSSEIYGMTPIPQDEDSRHHPRSPYGVSKLSGYWAAVNYREAFGFHVSNGILFNHESPIRGETFVTRKIARGLARIKQGKQKELRLGNLDARRDWGHAKDYVEAMWLITQQHKPSDYVIATGESHSVREFVQAAGEELGIDPWKHVIIDQKHKRPAEVDELEGNARKAREKLGWKPKVDFRGLVREMVEAEL